MIGRRFNAVKHDYTGAQLADLLRREGRYQEAATGSQSQIFAIPPWNTS